MLKSHTLSSLFVTILYYSNHWTLCWPTPGPHAPKNRTSAEEDLNHLVSKSLSEDLSVLDTYLKLTGRENDLCPFLPNPLSKADCSSQSCSSDGECKPGQSCCFNGCHFTCFEKMSPPHAYDWSEEPLLNFSRMSHDDRPEVLTCIPNSHVQPAHVRFCPEGFHCIVEEMGNPLEGVPKNGVCVPDTVSKSSPKSHKKKSRQSVHKESVFLPGGCLLTNKQYGDLEDFLQGGHYVSCKCNDGNVLCKVGYDKMMISKHCK